MPKIKARAHARQGNSISKSKNRRASNARTQKEAPTSRLGAAHALDSNGALLPPPDAQDAPAVSSGKKFIILNGKRLQLQILPQAAPPTGPVAAFPVRVVEAPPLQLLPPKLPATPAQQVPRLVPLGGAQARLTSDVACQTKPETREWCTQTSTGDGGTCPLTETFLHFLLDNSSDLEGLLCEAPLLPKPKTKEDVARLNFFFDLRKALDFDESGNLSIHKSVLENNYLGVRKNCVILKAREETPNIPNQLGYTPLHLAIVNNANIDIVELLLEFGADINAPDSDGNSALHLAVENNKINVLKILLQQMDKVVNGNIHLEHYNYDGFTPLMLACFNNFQDITLLLLNYGASPNLRDKKSGKTALFYAIETNNDALVQLLIEHKADTKIRNFFGTSPHDAMFEVDSISKTIKELILGEDHTKFQNDNTKTSERKIKKKYTNKKNTTNSKINIMSIIKLK